MEDFTPAVTLVEQAVPDFIALYLFGSRATGYARPDSDVDLAFLSAGPPLPAEKFIDLHLQLGLAFIQDVDLVDLARASTILQFHVVSEGRLLAAPQPFEAGMFEVRVYRDYQDLKMRRRDIEADIVRRGSVYAR